MSLTCPVQSCDRHQTRRRRAVLPFEDETALRLHIAAAHPDHTQCRHCSAWLTRQKLTRHVETQHFDESSTTAGSSSAASKRPAAADSDAADASERAGGGDASAAKRRRAAAERSDDDDDAPVVGVQQAAALDGALDLVGALDLDDGDWGDGGGGGGLSSPPPLSPPAAARRRAPARAVGAAAAAQHSRSRGGAANDADLDADAEERRAAAVELAPSDEADDAPDGGDDDDDDDDGEDQLEMGIGADEEDDLHEEEAAEDESEEVIMDGRDPQYSVDAPPEQAALELAPTLARFAVQAKNAQKFDTDTRRRAHEFLADTLSMSTTAPLPERPFDENRIVSVDLPPCAPQSTKAKEIAAAMTPHQFDVLRMMRKHMPRDELDAALKSIAVDGYGESFPTTAGMADKVLDAGCTGIIVPQSTTTIQVGTAEEPIELTVRYRDPVHLVGALLHQLVTDAENPQTVSALQEHTAARPITDDDIPDDIKSATIYAKYSSIFAPHVAAGCVHLSFGIFEDEYYYDTKGQKTNALRLLLPALNHKIQREILCFDPKIIPRDTAIRTFITPFLRAMERGVDFVDLKDKNGQPVRACGSFILVTADMLARWNLLHLVTGKTIVMLPPLFDEEAYKDFFYNLSVDKVKVRNLDVMRTLSHWCWATIQSKARGKVTPARDLLSFMGMDRRAPPPALFDDEYELFWRVAGVFGIPPCALHQHGLGLAVALMAAIAGQIDELDSEAAEAVRVKLNTRLSAVNSQVPTIILLNGDHFYLVSSRILGRPVTRVRSFTSEQGMCLIEVLPGVLSAVPQLRLFYTASVHLLHYRKSLYGGGASDGLHRRSRRDEFQRTTLGHFREFAIALHKATNALDRERFNAELEDGEMSALELAGARGLTRPKLGDEASQVLVRVMCGPPAFTSARTGEREHQVGKRFASRSQRRSIDNVNQTVLQKRSREEAWTPALAILHHTDASHFATASSARLRERVMFELKPIEVAGTIVTSRRGAVRLPAHIHRRDQSTQVLFQSAATRMAVVRYDRMWLGTFRCSRGAYLSVRFPVDQCIVGRFEYLYKAQSTAIVAAGAPRLFLYIRVVEREEFALADVERVTFAHNGRFLCVPVDVIEAVQQVAIVEHSSTERVYYADVPSVYVDLTD